MTFDHVFPTLNDRRHGELASRRLAALSPTRCCPGACWRSMVVYA
jgi:hypothetical protein